MSRIRSKGTRIERAVRGRLVALGARGWRTQARDLPGTPDFAFDQPKVAVFLDSCFWHGCPAHFRPPRSNRAFWRAKIAGNVSRDRRVDRRLRRMGWTVARVRECALAAHSSDGKGEDRA